MAPTVYNIHHRYWQTISRYTSEKTIQRNLQCRSCCSAACNRNCKNCVGTQFGFIFCSICCDHCRIYCINVTCIEPFNCIINSCIDIFNCFLYTFSKIACFISISEFQGFKLTCGCSTRCSSSSYGSIQQIHFCFYCRISSGIQDFSSYYFFDFKVHDQFPFLLLIRRRSKFSAVVHLIYSRKSFLHLTLWLV